jgi:hypothetical protein
MWYNKGVTLMLILLLSACSAFEEKIYEQQEEQLKCSPANSVNCTGWEV